MSLWKLSKTRNYIRDWLLYLYLILSKLLNYLLYLQAVENRAFVYVCRNLLIETVEVAFFVTGLETLKS
jgi:uncharacterized membrane protein